MGTHAVIVHIPLSDDKVGDAAERDGLFALEDRIMKAVAHWGCGELDGNEFGQGEWLFFLYGPDADALLEVVRPVLLDAGLPEGTRVVRRYGEPGTREVVVSLRSFRAPRGRA